MCLTPLARYGRYRPTNRKEKNMKTLIELRAEKKELEKQIAEKENAEKNSELIDSMKRIKRGILSNENMGVYGSGEVKELVVAELVIDGYDSVIHSLTIARGNTSNMGELYEVDFCNISRDALVSLCELWSIPETKILSGYIKNAMASLDKTCAKNNTRSKEHVAQQNETRKHADEKRRFKVTVNS